MDWEKPVIQTTQSDLNVLVHQVFSCEAGEKLLKLWIDEFLIKSPVAKAGLDSSYAYVREGQNQFLRTIIERKQAGLKYLKGETK